MPFTPMVTLVGPQTLLTCTHGAVVTVVVQDAEWVTLLPLHASVPVATTVSVKGPQPTGTVLVAEYVALPPIASGPMEIVMLPVEVSSTIVTPTSGTLPQLVTTPPTT